MKTNIFLKNFLWQGKVNHSNFFLHNQHRTKYGNVGRIPMMKKIE